MKRVRVGVLMGGKSKEREVSFNSGRTICDHLDTTSYEIIPVFQTHTGELYILPWTFLYRGKISDFEHRLSSQAKRISWQDLKNYIDFAYIAMHGRYAEDGTMQGMLELLQIPYFGSKVFASALGMDKIIQKKFLRMHAIEVPKDIVINIQEKLEITQLLKKLSINNLYFPLIVKPVKEGSSFGVTVVKNEEELIKAIEFARMVHEYPQEVLVEERIEGMEFSCIVITDNQGEKFIPLPLTEIVTPHERAFFDYDQKYMPGKSLQFTPARCSKEQFSTIQKVCLNVMHTLEFTNMGRIDGFLTPDNRVVIIDPNSFSGAAPSSFLFKQAAEINMNHTQLINHFIKTELQSYKMGSQVMKKNKNEKSEKKLRVAVLMGGNSDEKEISLESGRNITYKLSPQQYESVPIYLTNSLELYKINARILVSNSTKEAESLLKPSMKISWQDLPIIADFVFIGLHGGYGENGSVQGALELLGMPYNGSSIVTSALCMNKYKTNQLLLHEGFEVPQSVVISSEHWYQAKQEILASLDKKFLLPCIVKPVDSGCSIGVKKIINKSELLQAVDQIFDQGKKHVLVEEYINGMELTVGVIGNTNPQALPPSYAVCQQQILSIEEKFLPGAGENQTPAPLPKETLSFIQKTVEKAYTALNCKGYARLDCFYQSAQESKTHKERLVFIEVNTLPGMTPATCIFHQAAEVGIKPMDFIDLIIKYGLELHKPDLLEQYTMMFKRIDQVHQEI